MNAGKFCWMGKGRLKRMEQLAKCKNGYSNSNLVSTNQNYSPPKLSILISSIGSIPPQNGFIPPTNDPFKILSNPLLCKSLIPIHSDAPSSSSFDHHLPILPPSSTHFAPSKTIHPPPPSLTLNNISQGKVVEQKPSQLQFPSKRRSASSRGEQQNG